MRISDWSSDVCSSDLDVVARANASEYGLGGSVWGGDEDKAFAIAERIASGTVWVNETQHLSPTAAFGGMKQSGVGAEGGLEGPLEYTHAQTIARRQKAAAITRRTRADRKRVGMG